MRLKKTIILIFLLLSFSIVAGQNALVFQSDFGTRDAAVSAMKGVAFSVSSKLSIFDNTHEIPTYNIWEAAYRLNQAAKYWPKGTVFVSVVDPGVGTARKSVVLKTKSGHYFVTPDNGTLTLVAESLGIAAVREIDEAVNRRKNSEASYTFHGRDVYAYTGARLAAGKISFKKVGKLLPPEVVSLTYQKPIFENGVLRGNIPILDIRYGNVWTNINKELFEKLGLKFNDIVRVLILHEKKIIFEGELPYVATFGNVAENAPLLYLNSLNNIALALNMGSFAATYKISSGPGWDLVLQKMR